MAAKPHLQSVTDAMFTDGFEFGDQPAPLPEPVSPPAGGPPNRGGDDGNGRQALRARAEKNLPTDRLGFEKQVKALRAIGQLSGPQKRTVTAESISSELGLKGNSGGLSNKFFLDNGWIDFAGRGAYVATDCLVAFTRHLGMDPDDLDGARQFLVPSAKESWHWQELEGRVQGAGLRTTAALQALATAAGASHEHKAQLDLVIDWLAWLGLVRREDDKVIAMSQEIEHDSSETTRQPASDEPVALVVQEAAAAPAPVPAEAPAVVDSALFSMSFSVRITADDAAKLSDDQLRTVLEFADKMRVS